VRVRVRVRLRLRLGFTPNPNPDPNPNPIPNPNQIKGHPFFSGIDWGSLRGADAAPFKPHVESATDTSHFDKFEERPPNEQGAAAGDTVRAS